MQGTLNLILILSFLCVSPTGAEAQQATKIWRIGLFHVGLDHVPPSLDGLREGLRALGYEEGKTIHLDWRNLPDEATAYKTAEAFVRDSVDLLVAFEDQSTRAAKAATAEIPIIFLHVHDPVVAGFAQSLSHPGGNMTGFTRNPGGMKGKELELFKQLVPELRRVLVLQDPDDPLTPQLLAEVRKASVKLKLHLLEHAVTDQADIERLFGAIQEEMVDGVFVASPNLQFKFSSLLIRLATEHGIPLPAHRREWAEQGALFSYGSDLRATGRGAAQYVDKILQGAKPGDLPIEWRDRIELVINVKTAKALGLTISPEMLFQATKVIK